MTSYDFDIAPLENEILARLEQTHKQQAVEAFPEGAADYVLREPKGAILVIFNSAVFGSPGGLDGTGQLSDNRFQLSLVTRDLRGHHGAYALIASVIRALAGHRVGAYALYPRRVEFANRTKTQWQYDLLFEITTFFSNDPDESDLLSDLSN